ncbi:hypothetical protein R1sor_016025 [Riccia sorocarpa]|uniref:Uncharacterized protein n=1 Tax=Riccia sorocarpa TaxID=122646 RepID=A0ABD3HFP2_9MARC
MTRKLGKCNHEKEVTVTSEEQSWMVLTPELSRTVIQNKQCDKFLIQNKQSDNSVPLCTILTRREVTQGIRDGSSPPLATLSYTDSRRSEPLSIGLRAMEKANTILEDFCRTYFMFHDMDVTDPHHIFRYLPILYFTEAVIYQLDEENEAKLEPPQIMVTESSSSDPATQHHPGKMAVTYSDDEMQTYSDEQKEADPFNALRQLLISKRLMTEKIELEFKNGVEYWRLERKLTESLKLDKPVTEEEVFRTMMLRSSDYRILYHILCALSHRPLDEDRLEFLSVAELLGEVADDLLDYEEDVLKNTFNLLRMLVHTYGPTEAPTRLAEFLSAQEKRYQELFENLEPGLQKRFQKRCGEGRGSSASGNLGSMTIPPLIVDEDAFRNQVRYNSIVRHAVAVNTM